jgi:dCTP deaminase
MILSNAEIVRCLDAGLFSIDPLAGLDPTQPPFNTSAVDLRLAREIRIPEESPNIKLDLRTSGIARFLARYTQLQEITDTQPYVLEPRKMILAQTMETVHFPLSSAGICYSARVEGKSSLARCGMLVHFTAPTIHAGFYGPITLEMINLGAYGLLLYPGMFVCQLIIEEVQGSPADAPSQFRGQSGSTGS